MRRVIAALVSCIAVAAFAAGMSEQAFTDTYLQQARVALPGMEFKVLAPLQLQAKAKDGAEGTVFLTNAYTQYTAYPETLQTIIGNHIASLAISQRPVDPTALNSIFAVIKPADYVMNVMAQSAEAGGKISLVVENLNEDMRVLYVLDTETSMQMLTREGLKQTGVAESALRSVAVTNLERYFSDRHVEIERLEKPGKGRIYVVKLDKNYEASILLLDGYWNKKTFDVAGDIVAFVPSRDIVIVAGSDDQEGLAIAADFAKSGYAEFGYPISPHGYRRTSAGWTRFEP